MGQGKGCCCPAWCQHQCLSLLGCVALISEPPIKGQNQPGLLGDGGNEYAKAESVPVGATLRDGVVAHSSHFLGLTSVQ